MLFYCRIDKTFTFIELLIKVTEGIGGLCKNILEACKILLWKNRKNV
jgi:hypothetical protein